MARDDNVIENDVVKISPDLTGFREKLDAELKKAVAKVSATVKIKLVADAAGFNDSAKTALAKQAVLKNKPTYKIQLVADAKGFNASARAALKKAGISSVVAGSAGTKSSGSGGSSGSGDDGDAGLYKRVRDNLEKVEQAEDQAHSTRFSRTRSFLENVARAENAAYSENAKRDAGEYKRARNSDEARIAAHEAAIREDATRTVAAQSAAFARVRSLREALEQAEGKAQIADHLRTNTRIRDIDEKYAGAHLAALAENAARETRQVRVTGDELTRLHDIANQANARLDAAATKVAERESETRVRSARREADERQKALQAVTKTPQLIALGQSGIQPINLLRAGVLALAPALVAMGASAVQASTSIAALGAAGYGAGLGIAALAISFKGLTTVLALRKSVLAEQAQKAANAGTAADTLTAAIDSQRDAQDALTAAQRDEKRALADVHDARLQAAKDLVNLKQKVRDLQNQEKSDSLSVAEAKDAQAVVSRNYFATGLEKARATQDVNDAITRASDTRLDLKTSTGDLKTAVRKGVEGSPTVVNAKDRASDATRTRKRAQTTLKRASTATKKAGSGSTVSSAQANLDKELKQHSSAFRDLYGWIDKNADKFKLLRNRIEQATLPGFTTFLDDITQKGKIKGSIVDIVTDGIAGMGTQISKTAKKAGKFFSSSYFKGAAKKLNGVTERAFGSIGGSSVKLLKPLTQIFVAASPLLEKFADGFGKFADWFSKIIDKASKSGALQKWFEDAGTEAGKWLTITKNLITFVGNLFKLSLPTGNSLVQRFSDFTGQLASWSGSDSGKKQITDFFNFFEDLNYETVAKIVGSSVQFFAAFRIANLVKASPMALFFSAFATFAASNPTLTAQAMSIMADAMQNIVKAITEHPKSAATLLAIFAAAKAAKTLDIGLKLPGVDNLKSYLSSKFKFFEKLNGDQKTAVMTVHAGTVYINGKTATTPDVLPTAPGSETKTGSKILKGVEAVGVFNVVAAAVLAGAKFGWDEWNAGMKAHKYTGLTDVLKSGFDLDTVYKYFVDNSLVTLFSTLVRKYGDKLKRFFSMDLPNAVSGYSTGWAGVGRSLQDYFSTYVSGGMLLGLIDGLTGGRATKLYNTIDGWVNGIVDWVKKLFGIHSPSTVFASIGGDLVSGLWSGFVSMWSNLLPGAVKFLVTDVGQPLIDKLASIGVGLKNAFVHPFTTLVSGLAAPIKSAFSWINSHLIDPINALLGTIGIPSIDDLIFNGDTSGAAGAALGGAAGSAARRVAASLGMATGGTVAGYSPHSKADNIPAMLTANEYVQPVAAVKKYGVGFMDAVRTGSLPVGATPQYADGGLVSGLTSSLGHNLATDVISGALNQVKGLSLSDIVSNLTSSFFASTGNANIGDTGVQQLAYQTATSMGATAKQMLALFEAGLVESGFRNLSGGDRDSVGFLQQRPSQGWGSIKQLMDPAYATRKFIAAAKRVKGQEGLTAGQLAQKVQNSGTPLAYGQRVGDASAILAALTGGSGALASYTGKVPKGLGKVAGLTPTMLAAVIDFERQFPGTTVSSGLRNTITVSGNRSLHDYGRAADFVPHNMAEFNYLFNKYGTRAAELIYSPAGERQIKNGRQHYYTGAVRDEHFNHIHLALANGGQVKPRKYDSGGDLPPGYTLAYNGTGKTETVRTHKQEQALTAPAAVRLDRRDIALLAQHLGMVLNGQTIHMDGRKVAEATTRYNYLPAGV